MVVKSFVSETDQIRPDFSGFFVVDAEDGLVARIGDFLRVLREFNLGNEFLVFRILNGSQFIDSAECWAVFGSDQVCADAPGVNLCSLSFQAVDKILIQIAGSGDDRVLER